MKLLWICALAVPAIAQTTLPTGPGSILHGPVPVARPQATRSVPHSRGGYGYWGGGFWGAVQQIEVRPAPEPAEPKAPVLVNSNLYQPDRARPVMREYGALSTPATERVTLVAFRDGRVEPVWAYWREGEQFAYVAVGDAIRKVPLTTLDLERSKSLNLQQGIHFAIDLKR